MPRVTEIVVLAIAVQCGVSAQAAPGRPAFDVVSIKVNNLSMASDPVPRRSGDRIMMHNSPLAMMVIYAYGVSNPVYQYDDKRDSLGDTCFDIDAISPAPASENDLRLMFQGILEDRFKLRVHWETRAFSGYDLVIAKGRLKMKASTAESEIVVDGHTFPEGTSQMYIATDGTAHLIGRRATMEQLILQLTGRVRAPIQNRPGLRGAFDYDVPFALREDRVNISSAPILMTAIQEELGLKLEKSKVSAAVLVIDHVEKPSEN